MPMHAKREPARPRDGDAFLILRPFMWKELGLKGAVLLVFARIYGFCKDGGTFYESRRRTATYLGMSERSVIRAVSELEQRGLIAEAGGEWARDGMTTRSYVLGHRAMRVFCASDKLSPPDRSSASGQGRGDGMSPEGVPDWHLKSKEEYKEEG